MSVADQLGVADLQQALVEARQMWPDRVQEDSRLAQAPAVQGLQDWLLDSDRDSADDVLHGLVRIGSPWGGDCPPATWVAIWALLPGASTVSRRARGGRETDILIAGQLWLEVRQFPWWRHRKVAGNVMANLRSALARDGALTRPSWAERRTVPTSLLPDRQVEVPVLPEEELVEVLTWSLDAGLIQPTECLLLSSLVEQTGRLGIRPISRSGQGLMSASALRVTASEFGLSPWAVRRCARRSIDALASACRSGRFAASA